MPLRLLCRYLSIKTELGQVKAHQERLKAEVGAEQRLRGSAPQSRTYQGLKAELEQLQRMSIFNQVHSAHSEELLPSGKVRKHAAQGCHRSMLSRGRRGTYSMHNILTDLPMCCYRRLRWQRRRQQRTRQQMLIDRVCRPSRQQPQG